MRENRTPQNPVSVPLALLADGASGKAAVIGEALVRKITPGRLTPPLTFDGPVSIEEKTIRHMEDVVLSLIQRTLKGPQLDPPAFTISLVNLNAISAQDGAYVLTGFSGDLALAVGMLSAALEIPIRESILFTGHIASSEGDIRMVSGIPQKLAAAERQRTLKRVVYPSLIADDSFSLLLPEERRVIEDAIAGARGRLKLSPVKTITDAVKLAFRESDVLLSALRRPSPGVQDWESDAGPSSKLCQYLGGALESRFWPALAILARDGEANAASQLFGAWSMRRATHETYPSGAGARLTALLSATPPPLRQLLPRPLGDARTLLRLVGRAEALDFDDALKLLNAASGRLVQHVGLRGGTSSRPSSGATHQVEEIFRKISPRVLDDEIGAPIDAARGSYEPEHETVSSHEELMLSLRRFYRHIVRARNQSARDAGRAFIDAQCDDLASRAFPGPDGMRWAVEEARSGVGGGIRHLLDRMTNQYKRERYEKRVSATLKRMNRFDTAEARELMRALLAKMRLIAPDEIPDDEADYYTEHFEDLARAYVGAMQSFTEKLNAI